MDDQSVIFCFFLGYKRQSELKPSTKNTNAFACTIFYIFVFCGDLPAVSPKLHPLIFNDRYISGIQLMPLEFEVWKRCYLQNPCRALKSNGERKEG
jgi:hypothetical protein